MSSLVNGTSLAASRYEYPIPTTKSTNKTLYFVVQVFAFFANVPLLLNIIGPNSIKLPIYDDSPNNPFNHIIVGLSFN